MTQFKVCLYDAVELKARYVALWWDSRPIPERDKAGLETLLNDLPATSGLYAITGRHDAHHGEGVLYIGQGTRLNDRVLRSAEGKLIEVHGDGEPKMCADVWDLTVRWARLSSDLLDPVEALLIMSHMPPFNSQRVSEAARRKGPDIEDRDLVVMSAGRKGPLLPVAVGAYQCPWIDTDGRPMGPDSK